jgi:HSP20 family protein
MVKKIKPISHVIKIEAAINRIGGRVYFQRKEILSLYEGWVPHLDMYEKANEIILESEVPGVSLKDIQILLYSNRVEIKGMKKENVVSEKLRYLQLEREYGRFRRIVSLPCSITPEKTKATLENGILTIVLKKHKDKKDKDTEVKTLKNGE